MNYYPNWYAYQDPYYIGQPGYNNGYGMSRNVQMPGRQITTDLGPNPLVIDISDETENNKLFRKALWTGKYLQLTVMSINRGEDIGLEMHPDIDQFIRIEEGQGIVRMGDSPNNLSAERVVYDDYAILIPAGTWHNLVNIGDKPLKLYSIYSPPSHPFGTVHETKQEAMEQEKNMQASARFNEGFQNPYGHW